MTTDVFSKWVDADAGDSTIFVATGSLRFRLDAVCKYLPLAAKKAMDDIEYVHQTRVWTRRSAAAVQVYEEFLPLRRTLWLKRKLKQIRRACNDARDDDVFAARLEADKGNSNAKHLLKIVRRHRLLAQEPVVAVHDKLFANDKFARRIEKLLSRVRVRGEGEGDAETLVFGKWAVARLRQFVTDFFEASELDFTEYDNLHQFRIEGKNLRYAIELLSCAFDCKVRDEIYPQIESLQDRLGEVNDHETARNRLTRWMDLSQNKGDTRYLKALVDDEKKLLDESTAAFFDWWPGKREQELRDAFSDLLNQHD